MFQRHRIPLSSPCPQGLSIKRDANGIPHIRAANRNDLSWGLGYCQAIDRSTQLLMMRLIGQGRLCETLSDTEENLAIDTFFRRANWTRPGIGQQDSQLNELSDATREWCQAHCDGINAGLGAKRISALKLMGYTPEPWTLNDTLLIIRMSGYLTLAQSQAEIERLFIELVQAGIPTDKLASLFPVDGKTLDRQLIERIRLPERIVPSDLLWSNALPRAMASNNWVIHGKHTKNGSAMMANDPHLETNRLPNVWYEAALHAPDYQATGFGMPGLPGILVGRTPDISWGATYTFMDTVDSWVEDCRQGNYRRGDTWHAFQVREEIIRRKRHDDHTVYFYENSHGVLEGAPNEEGFYLSTRWSPACYGAQSLNASHALMSAQDTRTAMATLGEIESAWNWVIADASGDIGYQMSGLAPKRHPDWNGFTPAPGWDPAYDWQGFHPVKDLPQQFNPDCGYIVTANQDLNETGKPPVINMPMGDYRARRIESQLAMNVEQDVSSCQALQMDCYSLQAGPFLEILLPLIEQDEELRRTHQCAELSNWDHCYDAQSRGAVLFETFYAALRQHVFGQDGLGADVIRHLSQQTGVFIDFYQNFDRCMLDPESPWFQSFERDEAFLAAFRHVAQHDPGKRWGEINRFQFTNQLFQGRLPHFLGFDTDPVTLIGGRATPHQGQLYTSAGRSTSFAPSIRLIADMNDRLLHTCLAGGPSDNRFSPWYTSGIDDWLTGRYKRLAIE